MTDLNRLKVLAESLVIRAGSAGPDISADFLGLIAELEQCASALPGTYYMDPPDGGNVSIPEQIRRMAKDAARYRALRQKERGDVIVRDRVSHLIGEHLDAAIDAAEIGKSTGGGE
ncbi:hypothetical protein [Pseudomonas aeruginosa]|uniref:hypothetical protein n=1 Tax=Pseudomonas aeruginosa TaxID=287 RepID=UPI0021AFB25D|nr:hypothetical protein [Pseudomonas aeruginosa]MBX6200369.1 hypothetical protein [Pseudomonas aeruginosa]MCT5896236.1 hypothetical protein [Pseudomonas aeruginosa]MCZ7703938.1 hypothetical protein [Pseudomonas aeruginosa]MCZ7711020.1 hypothetical protein [Pseudomonas aeruginosa]MCZ7724367.1 hypothetical protein [Pseudomonas aeruginosa]